MVSLKGLKCLFSSKNKKSANGEIEAIKMHYQIEMQERDNRIQQLQEELNSAQIKASEVGEEKLSMTNQMKSKNDLDVAQAEFAFEAELIKSNTKVEVVNQLNVDLTKRNETLLVDLTKIQENYKKLEEGSKVTRHEAKKELKKMTDRLKAVEFELVDERKKVDSLKKYISSEIIRRNELVNDLDAQGLEMFESKQYEESIKLRYRALGIEEFGSKRAYWLGLLLSNISVCWDKLNRTENALQAVEESIEYNPSNALSFYNRAVYHKKLGNSANAIADAKKSIELNPNHSHAKYSRNIIARCE